MNKRTLSPSPLSPSLFSPSPAPLVVAYGMGVDSTAMLVGLRDRRMRPDLILFADTGAEKTDTYLYAPIVQAWLRGNEFPPITVVRYMPARVPDRSLLDEIQRLGTLPALAFGRHTCSLKWKRDAQLQFLVDWPPARSAWSQGGRVRQAIGYDDSPRDRIRSSRSTYHADHGDDRFDLWFPLQEWGWSRSECIRRIERERLPVPPKSSCFFCPAMTRPEIDDLAHSDPEQLRTALDLEHAYRNGRHYRPDGTQGLGRRFAWNDHINRHNNHQHYREAA